MPKESPTDKSWGRQRIQHDASGKRNKTSPYRELSLNVQNNIVKIILWKNKIIFFIVKTH
jgi:hypothetical protein